MRTRGQRRGKHDLERREYQEAQTSNSTSTSRIGIMGARGKALAKRAE